MAGDRTSASGIWYWGLAYSTLRERVRTPEGACAAEIVGLRRICATVKLSSLSGSDADAARRQPGRVGPRPIPLDPEGVVHRLARSTGHLSTVVVVDQSGHGFKIYLKQGWLRLGAPSLNLFPHGPAHNKPSGV